MGLNFTYFGRLRRHRSTDLRLDSIVERGQLLPDRFKCFRITFRSRDHGGPIAPLLPPGVGVCEKSLGGAGLTLT